jgi:hypothetical protein
MLSPKAVAAVRRIQQQVLAVRSSDANLLGRTVAHSSVLQSLCGLVKVAAFYRGEANGSVVVYD